MNIHVRVGPLPNENSHASFNDASQETYRA